MANHRTLTRIWLALITVTLVTALLAEGGGGVVPLLLICLVVAVKGKLVIEYLMGLAGTDRPVRWSMLSYFYLLPPVIALGWLFPQVIARLTTL